MFSEYGRKRRKLERLQEEYRNLPAHTGNTCSAEEAAEVNRLSAEIGELRTWLIDWRMHEAQRVYERQVEVIREELGANILISQQAKWHVVPPRIVTTLTIPKEG